MQVGNNILEDEDVMVAFVLIKLLVSLNISFEFLLVLILQFYLLQLDHIQFLSLRLLELQGLAYHRHFWLYLLHSTHFVIEGNTLLQIQISFRPRNLLISSD